MNGFDWRTFVARLPERIWFRLALFTVGALAVVGVAIELGGYLPDALAVEFGQDAALRILQILATSMLAVTTFSLTAMISAYSAAAAGTTPRATQLLVADRTSQNALSSFLGSFVFAIVGIVALSTGTFGEKGRSLLFLATLVVIGIVVVTLLRWIHHLTRFGRVPDVIDRVETAATDAICAYAREPHLGGVPPLAGDDGSSSALAVRAERPGCVTGIVMARLQAVAEAADGEVRVEALPGVTVGRGGVLARVVGTADGDTAARVRDAFRLEPHRTYEQDPRLGLVALAEIASRALSPSTNDPGTAVEALNAMQRVLTHVFTTDAAAEARFDRVRVPAVTLADLIEDGVRPVARDGAPLVEVGLRVQRVLGDLIAAAERPADVDALRGASMRAAERAVRALDHASDVELVEAAALEAQRG